MIRLATVALLASLPASAGHVNKVRTDARPAQAPRLEWSGDGGPDQRESMRATDRAGWKKLWETLQKAHPIMDLNGKPVPDPKKVTPPAPDFSRYVAVAVFAGECPSGGWTIGLQSELRDDDLWVLYRTRGPGPEALSTQALTYPWVVRLYPRPKGRVTLTEAR